ncbi:MAG: DUF1572 domain-containing protein [Ferruginibacter sp.]
MTNTYLSSIKKEFNYYKMLGEKAMAQVPAEKLFWQYNSESNSIATIVKHLSGNMLSRWTDFLTTDGEKEWRNRDAEFQNDYQNKEEMVTKWEEGWNCLLGTLDNLTTDDLAKEIFIRNMGHTVLEAINRQLAHYPYHIGQIIFIAKMICDDEWKSLSIPKGSSVNYNRTQFEKPKRTEHFTDEQLSKENKES